MEVPWKVPDGGSKVFEEINEWVNKYTASQGGTANDTLGREKRPIMEGLVYVK